MIKIGELSKICRVNIQTLRYYDRIGLLCADRVDTETGYRYYAPEKVMEYQTIVHLKSLEFSLSEIREFLQVSREKQLIMYQQKKQEILLSMREKKEIIQKIDDSCENPNAGHRSLNEQILEIPFEDDPAVVGKWVYCGNMDRKRKFTGTDALDKREVLQQNLYFLPGGSPVWMYFWTKGKLYYTLSAYNTTVPNEYRLFTKGDSVYMTVDFVAERFWNPESDDTVRVYQQVDTNARTKKDTYEFRDDVNLPFVPDERVLGEWEAVDVIKDPSAFTTNPDKWNKTLPGILGLVFYERGRCAKIRVGNTNWYQYTSGVILDTESEKAEKYTFLQNNGEDYLIVEHKTGDYSYLGEVYSYYVFRRKST